MDKEKIQEIIERSKEDDSLVNQLILDSVDRINRSKAKQENPNGTKNKR